MNWDVITHAGYLCHWQISVYADRLRMLVAEEYRSSAAKAANPLIEPESSFRRNNGLQTGILET